jgi:molecular chaperone DnaK (HSP70)
MPPTPFLIGVDLGTTNSAVAAVDTRRRTPRTEVFRVPQLIASGVVEPRPVLPSFLYFPELDEIAGGGIALPWDLNPSAIVGVLARDRGALAPARQVASAKSWLAHPGVDRHAPFLPWGSTGGTPRVSPVDASSRYLMHLRDAWNATMAAGDEAAAFERQSIVLTVPASFDEEARELTVEAARAAQLSTLTLLEEPIAAFYAWMGEQRRAIGLKTKRLHWSATSAAATD